MASTRPVGAALRSKTTPVMDEDIRRQQEEQQRTLEQSRHRGRQVERELGRLAAEIQQRHQQAGGDDAGRMQAADERDDDGGEAIAGRYRGQQLPDRTGDFADALRGPRRRHRSACRATPCRFSGMPA